MRCMCYIFLFIHIAYAKVWYVDTTGAEGDSIQKYVNIAHDSAVAFNRIDTVLLADGKYHMFINDTLGLIMRDSVVLMSQNGAESCTLTALSKTGTDVAWHVIFFTLLDTIDCKAMIKKLTITNGMAREPSPYGGGIFCYLSSPVIESCVIINNSADYGGGLYAFLSSPVIIGNKICNNSAYIGGGLFLCYGASTITENKIYNNSAKGGGGGVYINGSFTLNGNKIYYNSGDIGGGVWGYGSFILNGNQIYNNSVNYHGGGLYIGGDPTLIGNKIYNNFGNYGGGLCISGSSTLIGNEIYNNSANSYGGGLYIFSGFPILTRNEIHNNSTNLYGGGLCVSGSPTLNQNKIHNNSAVYHGAGLYLYMCEAALITNEIYNNSAYAGYGGGLYIDYYSSPTFKGDKIYNNSANRGGGIFVSRYSSAILNHSLVALNKANYGGAFYDSLNSKIVCDSSFIIDNGNIFDTKSGLAYISSDADSGVTFKINYSNVYYNIYQPDIEICNMSDAVIDLKNNFWWTTQDSVISALIYGANDYSNWAYNFIAGVPGEPVSVDSIRNYGSDWNTVVDTLFVPDTLYIRLYGADRNAKFREAAVVILKSSEYPNGIACALIETDTNTGVYEGKIYLCEAPGGIIRIDDILQRIRVNPEGDKVDIISNVDTTKSFTVIYKEGVGVKEKWISRDMPDLTLISLFGKNVIKYYCPVKSDVTINLFNISGRLIKAFKCGKKDAGHHYFKFNTTHLADGVYFIQLKTSKNTYMKTQKVILLK